MVAQTTVPETAPLTELVQALCRLEALERWTPEGGLDAPEVLDENRFLAARDSCGRHPGGRDGLGASPREHSPAGTRATERPLSAKS
jgi:hypothetical protein